MAQVFCQQTVFWQPWRAVWLDDNLSSGILTFRPRVVGDGTYQQQPTVCIAGHIFKKRPKKKKIKQTKQNITKKKDFISCRGADKCLVLHTGVRICYLNPGILSAFILKIFRLSTNWFVLMFPRKTLPSGWDNSKQREPPPLRHRLNRLLADLKCCQSKQT